MSLFIPVGAHTSRSDLAAVKTLTRPSGAVGASKLCLQAFTQNVRYTLDSATNPTATVGLQLKAADPPRVLLVPAGIQVRVIEEAVTAVLQYQWGD